MIKIILAALLLLLSGQYAIAESGSVETYQGIVNSTDRLPWQIVVNERRILLDSHVEIVDHKEKDKSLDAIKNGKWVYIVGEERISGLTATRIYILPGNIKNKDKRNYPFMQRHEEGE